HTRFSRDWSSDVCSSDLRGVDLLWRVRGLLTDRHPVPVRPPPGIAHMPGHPRITVMGEAAFQNLRLGELTRLREVIHVTTHVPQIGRASCRERMYVAGDT